MPKKINAKICGGGNIIKNKLNEKIRNNNDSAYIHNVDVDKQIAIAELRLDVIRQKISQIDLSWYPPDFLFSDAAKYFHMAIRNQMCDKLGEAVKLYNEQLFRNEHLSNQRKQISLAFTQCVLQAVTIDTIRSEGQATRNTIREEGSMTRGTIMAEGNATRSAIHAEGAASREQNERHHQQNRRDQGYW